MTVFSIIVCIMFIALGIGFIALAINSDETVTGVTIAGVACLIVGIICITAILTPDRPTALDVYRNKTTLEITYRDSIPVDTVVVFKDE